jgi:hypothetical protein
VVVELEPLPYLTVESVSRQPHVMNGIAPEPTTCKHVRQPRLRTLTTGNIYDDRQCATCTNFDSHIAFVWQCYKRDNNYGTTIANS